MAPKLDQRPSPSDEGLQKPYNFTMLRQECMMRGVTLKATKKGWKLLQEDPDITQQQHNGELFLYVSWNDYNYYFPAWRE